MRRGRATGTLFIRGSRALFRTAEQALDMRLHDDIALARPGKQAGAVEHRDAAALAGDETAVAQLLHRLAMPCRLAHTRLARTSYASSARCWNPRSTLCRSRHSRCSSEWCRLQSDVCEICSSRPRQYFSTACWSLPFGELRARRADALVQRTSFERSPVARRLCPEKCLDADEAFGPYDGEFGPISIGRLIPEGHDAAGWENRHD